MYHIYFAEIKLNYTSYPDKIVIEKIQNPKYEILDVQCDNIQQQQRQYQQKIFLTIYNNKNNNSSINSTW